VNSDTLTDYYGVKQSQFIKQLQIRGWLL